MSVRKQALTYTAAAVVVASLIMVASTLYLGPGVGGNPATTRSTSVQGGGQARLIIQLTDPPTVPTGTTSLNLTYSAIGILASEPASNGQETTVTLSVKPQGGSATVNLLKLQNVSQTIASANLANGSVVYSLAFNVTSISIDVNGTVSPVTLAAGGGTLTVTLARPTALSGVDVALIQLNPVIVDTPTGYQMIPSAVGIVRDASQQEQNGQVGTQQNLSTEDENRLESAQGNLSVSLKTLSVNGNITTITVEVRNSGNLTVVLNAIGVDGNFTATSQSCSASGGQNASESGSGNNSQTQGDASEGSDGANVTTSTTSTTSAESADNGGGHDCQTEQPDQLVFVPTNSTVSGTTCAPARMQLVNGDVGENASVGLSLTPGQCAELTFSGQLSLGQGAHVLVPSTASGQVFRIDVLASAGANSQLSCTLSTTSPSCGSSQKSED